MGKTFATSRVGCKIIANYNDERSYTLGFSSEDEAKNFESELNTTQVDFWKNGRDDAVRKKSMYADPLDCSVSVNFDTANCTEKWPFKVFLANVSEMNQFYADLKFALWGPMPSI